MQKNRDIIDQKVSVNFGLYRMALLIMIVIAHSKCINLSFNEILSYIKCLKENC